MRKYKFTIYTWYDNENDGYLETDSFCDFLKTIWRNRKYQMTITYNKSRRK